MALDATKRAEAAIRARGYFEQFEQRFGTYGAFDAYLAGGQALLPKDSVESFRSRDNNTPLYFPVLNKQSLTVITANSCTFTGQDPVSAKPQFSSIWRGFAINVYPKISDSNYISEMDQYAQGMRNGIRSILVNLDTYAAAQLETGKNTSLEAVDLPGVSIAANAYQIDAANKNELYFYLPTIAEQNELGNSALQNVMNTEGRYLMLKYEAMADANHENKRGVLEGTLPSANGYRHHTSKRVSKGAGVAETHYLVPFGGIGLFTFVDSDNRRGLTNQVGNQALYTETDSILGIEWGVTEEPLCSDLSGTYGAGYESVHGTRYRFLASFSFMKAYSSDATTPIIKAELLAS